MISGAVTSAMIGVASHIERHENRVATAKNSWDVKNLPARRINILKLKFFCSCYDRYAIHIVSHNPVNLPIGYSLKKVHNPTLLLILHSMG